MEFVQGKELKEFMESQKNKIKTNIKMIVTPNQSKTIQEIYLKNGIGWRNNENFIKNLDCKYLYVDYRGICVSNDVECYNYYTKLQEIDADLFIRTNGTCEENNNSIDYETLRISHLVLNSKYEELEEKLKKKNEILKKARIKRKNQREELHKLNLKLQKCISLEEHDLKMKTVLNEKHYLEIENKSLKESSKISCNMLHSQKDKIDRLELNYVIEQSNYKKEIEKLKAVIEYLESKVK